MNLQAELHAHGSSAIEGICNDNNILLHDEISLILLAEQDSQIVQQDNLCSFP